MLILTAIALASFEPTAAPADEFAPITVVGTRNPVSLTPKRLQRVITAYARGKARYAPQAPLAFELLTKDFAMVKDARVRLDDGKGTQMELPVGPDGRFELPAIDLTKGRWWVSGNRSARQAFFRPIIRSAGMTPRRWRVGDMRLQCRVGWALFKQDVELGARTVIDLAGGPCAFGVDVPVASPLASATLQDKGGTTTVKVAKDGMAFESPLASRRITDDAVITLVYR